MLVEWIHRGKPTVIGICSGAVAGLVAITPASGFVGPVGSLVHRRRRRRRLLLGRHRPQAHVRLSTTRSTRSACMRVGGIVGALLTGVFAVEQYGGTAGLLEGNAAQVHQPDRRRRDRVRLRRRRLADHPQDHRRRSSACASPRRWSAKASTSRCTARPCSSHARYGWGGYPAPPPPSGGPGRKTGASLLFGLCDCTPRPPSAPNPKFASSVLHRVANFGIGDPSAPMKKDVGSAALRWLNALNPPPLWWIAIPESAPIGRGP